MKKNILYILVEKQQLALSYLFYSAIYTRISLSVHKLLMLPLIQAAKLDFSKQTNPFLR